MSVKGTSNNNRVMPVPKSSGQMNQHQNQQQKQPKNSGGDGFDNGGFDKSSFEAPQTKVPVRGIGVDVFGAAEVGKNSYLVSEWDTTQSKVGANVRIRAKLSRPVDGVARVQIFHEYNGQETWVDSADGFINKGVVTVSWVVKDNIADYDKGVYFFTIIGGRGMAQSTNRLKLSGK